MSRSYKKHLVIAAIYDDGKKKANKKVRRLFSQTDEPYRKGRLFKKMYPMWNVCDYRDRAPSFERFYQQQISRWRANHIYWWKDKSNPPSKEACSNVYNKWYRRK